MVEETNMANGSRWPRLEADGAVWEARVVPGSGGTQPSQVEGTEVLEFSCVTAARKPRRLAIPAGRFQALDPAALGRIYRQARPIGGDHYGRPGKPAGDAP
jgi:hypothetical protein